jgi:predicted nuclease of predicted toxin-antitoxin system
MALKKVKFLLDENIPIKLKHLFTSLDLSCITIRDLGLLGIRNGELSKRVKKGSFLLVTRDKDFTFLWDKFQIQVIHIAIKPALLSAFTEPLENLLTNWHYDLTKPFLLILQKDSIRFRQ